ncbi:MAG TPA: hypothetical protein VGC17_08845 [Lactovum miscens]|uniref:hypothetical protein n=1 Tax=Lactovum miscens TaxID=190387 RepID=UPI002ED8856B
MKKGLKQFYIIKQEKGLLPETIRKGQDKLKLLAITNWLNEEEEFGDVRYHVDTIPADQL